MTELTAMTELHQHTWTLAQKQAVVAGVRDLLEGDESPRARDALALAEEVLGAHPGRGEPDSYALFRGDPLAEAALIALMVAACIRAEGLREQAVDRIAAYAKAMAGGAHWVDVLRHAARGHGHRVTMAMARRAPDGKRVLAAARRRHGPLVIFEIVRTILGKTKADPELGWYFKQLGLLPEGSVGRSFWSNMTTRKIALPGEPGGLPEAAIHHDLVHTLTGYDTDAAGECQIGGFYAGTLYPDWPAWILAGLTTFELALRVGPAFTVPTKGAFDVRRVWAAALRGYGARFRPLDDWDYRPLMAMPLDAARRELGI